ncbi:unnamed protein product, partial [Scytosiphon promiscuus]
MAPTLGPKRSWSGRSSGAKSTAAIPTAATAATERTAGLNEPASSKRETSTQLACPPRSRYVRSGETGDASQSPPNAGSSARAGGKKGSKGEGFPGGGELQRRHQPPQQQQQSSGVGSGGDSAQRSDGRANFFFGADYAGKSKGRARAEQDAAARARLSEGDADGKGAALLGGGMSPGSVASKALRFLGGGQQNDDLSYSKKAIAPPPQEEAPPGLEPLDSAASDHGGGGMSAEQQGRSQSGQAAADSDAHFQVGFPPHFDGGLRKSGSGSEDGSTSSSTSSKVRGSGDSLGTKSGSTSLLSMLSGSPRSLGTAPDSTGSPRTPLSDNISTDGGSGSA